MNDLPLSPNFSSLLAELANVQKALDCAISLYQEGECGESYLRDAGWHLENSVSVLTWMRGVLVYPTTQELIDSHIHPTQIQLPKAPL